MKHSRGVLLIGLCVVAAVAASVPLLAAGNLLDDGRLQMSWFGEDLKFVEADEIDYLWVKEGFGIEGKSFFFPAWPQPEFVGEKAADRDQDDKDLAKQMNAVMHELFARVWADEWKDKGATTSLESGDVKVEGRIVDCNTGSRAAKIMVGWGAGAGGTTIDLKFTDAASGELLAALHHRVVSGTSWSTTDSKFKKWIKEAGEEIAKKGFAKLYAKGKRVKK